MNLDVNDLLLLNTTTRVNTCLINKLVRINHECKVHRYSRIDRFKFTVLQLLGFNGAVPKKVIETVQLEIGKYVKSNSKIWNTIRKILKENGYRKYYNRIPKIISIVAGFQIEGVSKANMDSLFKKFQKMSFDFNNELRQKWNRSYFPNLRYIALRMISEIGITYPVSLFIY